MTWPIWLGATIVAAFLVTGVILTVRYWGTPTGQRMRPRRRAGPLNPHPARRQWAPAVLAPALALFLAAAALAVVRVAVSLHSGPIVRAPAQILGGTPGVFAGPPLHRPPGMPPPRAHRPPPERQPAARPAGQAAQPAQPAAVYSPTYYAPPTYYDPAPSSSYSPDPTPTETYPTPTPTETYPTPTPSASQPYTTPATSPSSSYTG